MRGTTAKKLRKVAAMATLQKDPTKQKVRLDNGQIIWTAGTFKWTLNRLKKRYNGAN